MDTDITSHRVVIGLFYHKIIRSSFRKTFKVSMSLNDIQGRIQDFQLGGGGGALKIMAPSGERRGNVQGISFEKSRF